MCTHIASFSTSATCPRRLRISRLERARARTTLSFPLPIHSSHMARPAAGITGSSLLRAVAPKRYLSTAALERPPYTNFILTVSLTRGTAKGPYPQHVAVWITSHPLCCDWAGGCWSEQEPREYPLVERLFGIIDGQKRGRDDAVTFRSRTRVRALDQLDPILAKR